MTDFNLKMHTIAAAGRVSPGGEILIEAIDYHCKDSADYGSKRWVKFVTVLYSQIEAVFFKTRSKSYSGNQNPTYHIVDVFVYLMFVWQFHTGIEFEAWIPYF